MEVAGTDETEALKRMKAVVLDSLTSKESKKKLRAINQQVHRLVAVRTPFDRLQQGYRSGIPTRRSPPLRQGS